jgi:hypothetical protein
LGIEMLKSSSSPTIPRRGDEKQPAEAEPEPENEAVAAEEVN